MAKIEYYQDQLVKVWERRTFTIEADSIEEADEIAKKIARQNYQVCDDEKDNVAFIESETLFETSVNIYPRENNNKRTMDIFRKDKLIATNLD